VESSDSAVAAVTPPTSSEQTLQSPPIKEKVDQFVHVGREAYEW
jgi:hypothetical protein